MSKQLRYILFLFMVVIAAVQTANAQSISVELAEKTPPVEDPGDPGPPPTTTTTTTTTLPIIPRCPDGIAGAQAGSQDGYNYWSFDDKSRCDSFSGTDKIYCFENPQVDLMTVDRLDLAFDRPPAASYDWVSNTTDPRAPLTSSAADAGRVAAAWYACPNFTVDLNLTDGATHQVALYALDWDNAGRTERVDVVDPANGSVLDSRTVSSFTGGQYLVYNVTGHVQFRITDVAGANAVLNGIFFDGTPSPPSPTFVRSDTSTQGNWPNLYGGQGYSVVGGTSNLPSFASVTTFDPSLTVLPSSSWTAFAAQVNGAGADHPEACYICGCFREIGCFAPGVKITMADGSLRNIEDVRAGDSVRNAKTGAAVKVGKVIEGPEALPLIRFGFEGTTVTTSQAHPVLTATGLKPANELKKGDTVFDAQGNPHSLTILETLPLEEGQRVINVNLDAASSDAGERLIISDGIITGDIVLQGLLKERK